MKSSAVLQVACVFISLAGGCVADESDQGQDPQSSQETAGSDDPATNFEPLTTYCYENCRSNDPSWIAGLHYRGFGTCSYVQTLHGGLADVFAATYKGGYWCGPHGSHYCRKWYYREYDGTAVWNKHYYTVDCNTGAFYPWW
jgi:hypothetical protein